MVEIARGKYFEEIEVGMKFKHAMRLHITQELVDKFNELTSNTQDLHSSPQFAQSIGHNDKLVPGTLVFPLVVHASIPELTQRTIVARFGYDNLIHHAPVFIGDILNVTTHINGKLESKSRPEAGIVMVTHRAKNQNELLVFSCDSTIMSLKKNL